MEKIINYNCEGLCIHESCSNKYTQFEEIDFYGMKIIVMLCDKHADQWEKLKTRKYRYMKLNSDKLEKIPVE